MATSTTQSPLELADALLQQGDLDSAVAQYDIALLNGPLNATAFHNRGYALERLGRWVDALGNYCRAISLQPDFPEAYCNRGNTFFAMKRYDQALADYESAIFLKPDYAPAYNNKGNVLVTLKRVDEALACLRNTLILSPDYIEAHNNLGYALQKAGRHDEALASLERAIELRPDYAEAHNNLGHSLHKLNRLEAALASFEQAVALRPDYADAIWNRGLIRLLMGDMPGGWQDLEWRWQRPDYQKDPGPRDSRKWNGEDLAGRSITVLVEQGFGDMIQLCRYLLLLLEAGADVTFAAPRIIHRLFTTLSPKLKFRHSLAAGEPSDFYCTLFSLPTVFATRLDTIPCPVPYLQAEPERVEHWRERIGREGFKVAVSWQGNPAGDVDIGRSLPLAALAPLSTIPGVRLISIQFQHGLEQLENLPPGMQIEVLEEFNTGPDGFVDTAAVMQCVDLVLTTDSSPAHLAGALGVPVWTLLMEVPDWRWLMGREDNPWYPSMRLFRQPVAGDWSSVVKAVHEQLLATVTEEIWTGEASTHEAGRALRCERAGEAQP